MSFYDVAFQDDDDNDCRIFEPIQLLILQYIVILSFLHSLTHKHNIIQVVKEWVLYAPVVVSRVTIVNRIHLL